MLLLHFCISNKYPFEDNDKLRISDNKLFIETTFEFKFDNSDKLFNI